MSRPRRRGSRLSRDRDAALGPISRAARRSRERLAIDAAVREGERGARTTRPDPPSTATGRPAANKAPARSERRAGGRARGHVRRGRAGVPAPARTQIQIPKKLEHHIPYYTLNIHSTALCVVCESRHTTEAVQAPHVPHAAQPARAACGVAGRARKQRTRVIRTHPRGGHSRSLSSASIVRSRRPPRARPRPHVHATHTRHTQRTTRMARQ